MRFPEPSFQQRPLLENLLARKCPCFKYLIILIAEVTNFTDIMNTLGLEGDLIKVNEQGFTFWGKGKQMFFTLKIILKTKIIVLD